MSGPRPAILPRVVFLGRSLAEYQRIWGLSPGDLIGQRVLDCPCGPAGFVAGCRASGVEAVGCDPVLALELEEIRRLGERDRLDTAAALAASDAVLASHDPEAWNLEKTRSLRTFLEDFAVHGPHGPDADGRYVAASLPNLPFADQAFDLVLSAHFLFTYAPAEAGGMVEAALAFDLQFHLAAAGELARVSAKELRLYPIYAADSGHPRLHPFLEPVRGRLVELGFATEVVRSGYDQGVEGVPDTLVARRR